MELLQNLQQFKNVMSKTNNEHVKTPAWFSGWRSVFALFYSDFCLYDYVLCFNALCFYNA